MFVIVLRSEVVPQCSLTILQEHSPPSWTAPGFILAFSFSWRFLESQGILILYVFLKKLLLLKSRWVWKDSLFLDNAVPQKEILFQRNNIYCAVRFYSAFFSSKCMCCFVAVACPAHFFSFQKHLSEVRLEDISVLLGGFLRWDS